MSPSVRRPPSPGLAGPSCQFPAAKASSSGTAGMRNLVLGLTAGAGVNASRAEYRAAWLGNPSTVTA
jgi:hypothetical protein